jgi:hypothetical protein
VDCLRDNLAAVELKLRFCVYWRPGFQSALVPIGF